MKLLILLLCYSLYGANGTRHNTSIQKRQLMWDRQLNFDQIPISSSAAASLNFDLSMSPIPGEPGIDYPTLGSIPLTHFHCRGQVPGYYGDTETACQVFHVCHTSGRQDSFLCPNGTIFSQQLFSCDWWYNVKCGNTEKLYRLNRNLFLGGDVSLYGTGPRDLVNWLEEGDEKFKSTTEQTFPEAKFYPDPLLTQTPAPKPSTTTPPPPLFADPSTMFVTPPPMFAPHQPKPVTRPPVLIAPPSLSTSQLPESVTQPPIVKTPPPVFPPQPANLVTQPLMFVNEPQEFRTEPPTLTDQAQQYLSKPSMFDTLQPVTAPPSLSKPSRQTRLHGNIWEELNFRNSDWKEKRRPRVIKIYESNPVKHVDTIYDDGRVEFLPELSWEDLGPEGPVIGNTLRPNFSLKKRPYVAGSKSIVAINPGRSRAIIRPLIIEKDYGDEDYEDDYDVEIEAVQPVRQVKRKKIPSKQSSVVQQQQILYQQQKQVQEQQRQKQLQQQQELQKQQERQKQQEQQKQLQQQQERQRQLQQQQEQQKQLQQQQEQQKRLQRQQEQQRQLQQQQEQQKRLQQQQEQQKQLEIEEEQQRQQNELRQQLLQLKKQQLQLQRKQQELLLASKSILVSANHYPKSEPSIAIPTTRRPTTPTTKTPSTTAKPTSRITTVIPTFPVIPSSTPNVESNQTLITLYAGQRAREGRRRRKYGTRRAESRSGVEDDSPNGRRYVRRNPLWRIQNWESTRI